MTLWRSCSRALWVRGAPTWKVVRRRRRPRRRTLVVVAALDFVSNPYCVIVPLLAQHLAVPLRQARAEEVLCVESLRSIVTMIFNSLRANIS